MFCFKLQNFNVTNSSLFGLKQVGIDTSKDLNVTIKGVDNKRLRMARILQYDLRRFNLNPDSPVVIVSSNISKALNSSDIKYNLIFIKDPKPMLKSGDELIHSQLYLFSAFNTKNNTLVTFPNNTESLKIEIPWTYVPFKNITSRFKRIIYKLQR